MANLRTTGIDRRTFLAGVGGLASVAAAAGSARAQNYGQVVGEQPFARIEKLGENVWAVVSTPLNHDHSFNPQGMATLCNGGIVAGADRVAVIDGFYTPAGGAWVASMARELTGRDVTDVIVTHFHADHTGGLAGFQRGAEGPEIYATETTRKLIFERYSGPNPVEGSPFSAPAIRPVLPTRIITDETNPVSLDLGGRSLTLEPLLGHTPSDLAIQVDDAPVLFAGDLVWAGLFHNYMDAIPSKLRKSAGRVLKDKNTVIVTGHGYVAKARDLQNYLRLLDHVEEAARAAFEAGKSPEEGAAAFSVPESLGEWALFNPKYYEVAFAAWRRELEAA
ncbi:MAG: MBL fold metallo-hydrolase [Caulobacterales bacterium]|nr:MBL fold metallo-hydrolase [Caulobacterales bacterium]HRX38555.1 MBL fold metallo-hydrolase [Parvularculaceae bacterium]